MRTLSVLLLFAAAFVAAPALAQNPALLPVPPHMPMARNRAAAPEAADKALMDAMQHMNNGMNVPLTGNPDRDFVAMMIPHHQGAVDMAEVELRYGDDPQMRALARQIVAAQNRELALMNRWQTRHAEKHAQ